ncbi:MAG: translation initiation factor IF-3 [Candidatus Omnitrophica bacterium]|nr:translation initiation factor IF-3 [Candidatus Omnitrophota bacterium]
MIFIKINIRYNEKIRVPKIRVIDQDGNQLGIMSPREALFKAREVALDLVEVSPNADPPVCRILDYGKYVYDLNKKEKEARKKQHVMEVKEIKLTPNIDDHDLETKLRHSEKFLGRGDKLKLTMFFRGREMAHVGRGKNVLSRFISLLEDYGEVEKNAGLEGNLLTVYMMPLKGGRKSTAE